MNNLRNLTNAINVDHDHSIFYLKVKPCRIIPKTMSKKSLNRGLFDHCTRYSNAPVKPVYQLLFCYHCYFAFLISVLFCAENISSGCSEKERFLSNKKVEFFSKTNFPPFCITTNHSFCDKKRSLKFSLLFLPHVFYIPEALRTGKNSVRFFCDEFES